MITDRRRQDHLIVQTRGSGQWEEKKKKNSAHTCRGSLGSSTAPHQFGHIIYSPFIVSTIDRKSTTKIAHLFLEFTQMEVYKVNGKQWTRLAKRYLDFHSISFGLDNIYLYICIYVDLRGIITQKRYRLIYVYMRETETSEISVAFFYSGRHTYVCSV